MITKEQILSLGFEHKNYNKFSGINDYRHPKYPFLLCLHDGSVQVITASNKKDGSQFQDFNDLEKWLSNQ